jgi:hypothetical protein
MLPQANLAYIWSNVQFVDRPRKSCYFMSLLSLGFGLREEGRQRKP